jgi:beta-glucosidase
MEGRTYRYYRGEPLYPFGYGLTYGDVYAESAALSGKASGEKGALLKVKIRNDGRTATEDVLQVYIKPENSEFAPPRWSLCAFSRISVSTGEAREVEIALAPGAFTVVNDGGERVSGGKEYTLYAGFGQPDERTRALTGHGCVSVKVSLDA